MSSGEITNPDDGRRVLVWVCGEEYPFVGYIENGQWYFEAECLDCDIYRNDAWGEVVAWIELPTCPVKNIRWQDR